MAKRRFQLLKGNHTEGGEYYRQGAVVETDNDLVVSCGADKFVELGAQAEEVPTNTEVKSEQDTLDDRRKALATKSAQELKSIAKAKNIEIKPNAPKAEIVEAILEAS